MDPDTSDIILLLGTIGFGAVIGFCTFLVIRRRKDNLQLSDLAALIPVIGGGAITALFPLETYLFGAYGIGLAMGFMFCFVASFIRTI
jgi:hypothetical protein